MTTGQIRCLEDLAGQEVDVIQAVNGSELKVTGTLMVESGFILKTVTGFRIVNVQRKTPAVKISVAAAVEITNVKINLMGRTRPTIRVLKGA